MSASIHRPQPCAVGEALVPTGPLTGLAKLASLDIATSVVGSLQNELHTLFDPVSDDVLPIYFGPLLGRLYLEGL